METKHYLSILSPAVTNYLQWTQEYIIHMNTYKIKLTSKNTLYALIIAWFDTMLHGLMYKHQVQVCVLTSDSSNSYVQLHGATKKYSYFLIYQQ